MKLKGTKKRQETDRREVKRKPPKKTVGLMKKKEPENKGRDTKRRELYT